MAYKDKDKQREANRQAKQRQRAKQGMTEGMTSQGMTVLDEPPDAILSNVIHKAAQRLKRGKDIKCFEDLHPGIQSIIKDISTDENGKLDEDEKRRRTANAIHYQHMFPERYEPKSRVG